MNANWTINVYTQERNILTLSNFSTGTTSILLTVAGHSELVANYAIPSSGVLQIDLSSLVRLYQSGSFTAKEQGGSGSASQTLLWSQAGLINPRKALVPSTEITSAGAVIAPPSRMLYCGFGDIICEAFFDDESLWSLSGAAIFVSGTDGRKIQCIGNFTLSKGNISRQGYVDAFPSGSTCVDAALVRWTSFTGIQRQHYFEVVKQTANAIDIVGLQTIDGQYDEHKGRRDGFTLRLGELSRYDFWYYADIITSSKVEVSFDGTNWRQVQVTSKSAEMPNNDEGAFNSLEIEVNYKQYDTI